MLKSNSFFVTVIASSLLTGCGTVVIKNHTVSNEPGKESLNLTVKKMNAKGKKKMDADIVVKNNYDKWTIIPENTFRLYCGNQEAMALKTNPRWVLRPGDTARAKLKFRFDEIRDQDCSLKMQLVYRGVSSREVVSNGASRSIGSAYAVGNAAVGVAHSASSQVTYQQMSSVEDERLPEINILFNTSPDKSK